MNQDLDLHCKHLIKERGSPMGTIPSICTALYGEKHWMFCNGYNFHCSLYDAIGKISKNPHVTQLTFDF